MNCPKCGSSMVVRTARKGRYAGQRFYGCSRYPRCRGIVPLSAAKPIPSSNVVIDKKVESTGFWVEIRKKVAQIPVTDAQVDLLDGYLGFVIPTGIAFAVGLPLAFLTRNWYLAAGCAGGSWALCTFAVTSFTDIKREDRRERQQRERQPELDHQAKEQLEKQQAEALERVERQRIEQEERQALERQRREINQLIDVTLGMTESGISSSTHGDDSLLLGALLILRQQLEECRAQFGGGTLSYEAAKARVAELKEQAGVLISPSASSEREQVSAEETHYAILGVARIANQEEVRKAYREKQRRLHPDTIAAWAKDEVPQEVKDFLNENAKRLNLAYQILSDPKKRKDYDASIERRTSDG